MNIKIENSDIQILLDVKLTRENAMNFPYKLIDLTHTLDSAIPAWNGGCGFNHDLHIDYSDCEGEDKFRVMKVKMHAGIGTHMDAPSHCIAKGKCIHDYDVNNNNVFPSVDSGAAELLLERGVSALGIDTLSPDRPEDGFKVHICKSQA